MLISVVTNSYNQAGFLRACIESVLAQDYAELEYIVVDAGSVDGSRDVLDEYRGRLRVLHVAGLSAPAALDHAFRQAQGEWIGYVNSDDVYLPGAVRRAAAFIRANPEAHVVYGDGVVIDSDGAVVAPLHSAKWDLRGFVLGVYSAVQPATFIRRDSYVRSRGFNPDNRSCWDRELLLDLALSGARYAFLPTPLAGFRLHPASITGSGRLRRENADEHARLIRKVLGRPPQPRDDLARAYYRLRRRLSRPEIMADDLRRAIAQLRSVTQRATAPQRSL